MWLTDIDRAHFLRVCCNVTLHDHERFNIGTYKEKKLHLILKEYFAESKDSLEMPVCGFIADVFNKDRIFEIQTSGFSGMQGKLEKFLAEYPVTIVFPIAYTKSVLWIEPETGEISQRHKSPKKGSPLDAIPEMVYILPYLDHPNLSVYAVLLDVDEYRLLNGKRSLDRKRGSTRYERIPVDLCSIYEFTEPSDYRSLLPNFGDNEFTAEELFLALKMRCGGRLRSAFLKVLMTVGCIERVGKRGKAFLYRIVADA